jgi:hypothetical protein
VEVVAVDVAAEVVAPVVSLVEEVVAPPAPPFEDELVDAALVPPVPASLKSEPAHEAATSADSAARPPQVMRREARFMGSAYPTLVCPATAGW